MKRKKIPLQEFLVSALLSVSLILGQALPAFAAEESPAAENQSETAAAEAEVFHTAYYDQPIQSNQWENWPQGPAIEAQAGIVLDFNTGAILYAKNIDERLYPASITKIMTTLLACENCQMDAVVTTSENAVYGISEDSSKAYLEVGEELTMTQMLMAVMLQSANDAAYAVAEHTSGSMKKFVEAMNTRARQIGCTNTHFNNPHGLHASNHYTTARDMAMIMRTAWRNARFRAFAGKVTYEIPPTNKTTETRYYLNNHKMMKTETYEYSGVLGGKTGYTDQAGNTLVTVAKQGSMTLVAVILNGVNGAYGDTANLLDYAFQNFKNQNVTSLLTNETSALPCDQMLFSDNRWPSLLEPAATYYYVTIPAEASVEDLHRTDTLYPGSPGGMQVKTEFYYGNQLAGTCFSYEKEVLPDLLNLLLPSS